MSNYIRIRPNFKSFSSYSFAPPLYTHFSVFAVYLFCLAFLSGVRNLLRFFALFVAPSCGYSTIRSTKINWLVLRTDFSVPILFRLGPQRGWGGTNGGFPYLTLLNLQFNMTIVQTNFLPITELKTEQMEFECDVTNSRWRHVLLLWRYNCKISAVKLA